MNPESTTGFEVFFRIISLCTKPPAAVCNIFRDTTKGDSFNGINIYLLNLDTSVYNCANLAVYSGTPLANLMLFNVVNVSEYLLVEAILLFLYISVCPTGLGVNKFFMCTFGAPENKFIAMLIIFYFFNFWVILLYVVFLL